jgi:hypothetical protein
MKNLISMKERMSEIDMFFDVEINDVLQFKLRNTVINHFEEDNVICHCFLTSDGELTIEYKDNDILIKTSKLKNTQIFSIDTLLEVLYNRIKFYWENALTDISDKYYWIHF